MTHHPHKTVSACLLALLLGGCASASAVAPSTAHRPGRDTAPTQATVQAPQGHGIDDAIPVHAQDEASGVRAEYTWIAQHYPGFRRDRQALQMQDGRAYDRIDITTAQDVPVSLYFDISAFFGKD